jgi:50S ribosomal subunit-associated GTPase HflX
MTPNNDGNYRDLITRIAQLEYRLTRVESTQTQLENTMTPGGYITDSFDRVHAEIDELRGELRTMNSELNGKIDIILRHITGQGNS